MDGVARILAGDGLNTIVNTGEMNLVAITEGETSLDEVTIRGIETGYDDDTIKKLGRLSSNTYLRYIQSQIGNLMTGIATRMSTILRFHNVSSY